MILVGVRNFFFGGVVGVFVNIYIKFCVKFVVCVRCVVCVCIS